MISTDSQISPFKADPQTLRAWPPTRWDETADQCEAEIVDGPMPRWAGLVYVPLILWGLLFWAGTFYALWQYLT